MKMFYEKNDWVSARMCQNSLKFNYLQHLADQCSSESRQKPPRTIVWKLCCALADQPVAVVFEAQKTTDLVEGLFIVLF